jgi:UvrD-like helicase C-terminal domain
VEPGDVGPPLPSNLRNTRAIHEFVSVFYKGATAPRSKGPPGRVPLVLGYRDDDGLARLLGIVLQNLVDQEAVRVEDIVVLTPSRQDKSTLRQRGVAGRFRLSDDPGPGEVLAATVHSFKGMESQVVVLAEIGDRHLENLDQYLYVGGSRARTHLIVLAKEPVDRTIREMTGAAGPQ